MKLVLLYFPVSIRAMLLRVHVNKEGKLQVVVFNRLLFVKNMLKTTYFYLFI